MEKHVYEARQKDENGPYILFKDGKISACPKMPPIAVPSQLEPNKVEFERHIGCTTQCTHAELSTVGDNEYTIFCEGGRRKLKLDAIVPFQKPAPFVPPLITGNYNKGQA
jgi:hypothetical protein